MLSLQTIFWRLACAAGLGAVIGLERTANRRPAGIRTSLCVCMGAALFTILSGQLAILMNDTSGTRIASNIVQGIGFLGAGVILRERGNVVGLTTAAAIFVEAAIGMAAGGGLYLTAAISAAIVLFALIALAKVEKIFHLKPRFMLFRVSTDKPIDLVTEIHRIFNSLRIAVTNMHLSNEAGKRIIQLDADVTEQQQAKILTAMVALDVTCDMLPVERLHE